MIRKSTLALGFRALLILASLQAPAQNQRIAQQVASPSSVIPAYLKFEEGSGPSQVEFPRYLESNYKLPAGFSWKLIKEEKDNAGFSHQRFIQTYQGKELKGTMLISHSKNGIVSSFNGESTSEIPATSSASLVAADARVSALKYINAKTYKWQMPEEEAHLKKEQNDPKATFFPQGELVFYKPAKGSFQLAYRFDIYAHEPVSRQYVYVDANSGKVLGEEELILHTDEIGTAVTGYSGTQQITADNTGAGFRLRESGRGLGIETYNLQKGTSYAAAVDFTDTDNVWNNVNANEDQYATDAHFGAEKTYDYFMSRFNRNSIDGNGFKLISYVHYSTNYVNAYWDGSRMTYGDGDATYNPLTSMDIAGHEITHGLTNFSANLVYSYESGALNESFSDIFGTAIEFYSTPGIADWLIGEDIGGAFRSMSNPNVYGQPDTYLGTSWYAGAGDNGGVHYNSGVQNFWFYLLSVGGSGTNDIGNAYNVSAIGIDKAAAIAFRTLTTYLTPNSQYADARFYSIQAATDLYGACSPEVIATTAAWYAVGVGSNTVSANPIITYSGSTTLCSGNTITLNASNLPNYQWNLNGQPISGATAQSYTTGASGSYTVSTLACNNTYTSIPVAVNVTTAAVSVQAAATNSCEPINITATASPGYALQWMKNGIDISGANQSTYEASTSGSYAARINSTIGPAVTLNSTGTSSIPDNSCPGATNIIVASGLPTAMNPAGLSVRINITHTWNADLKIWLEAPNGDLLGLANAVGGSADNFTNTVFSDAGTTQIPASGAPYTGTYKPWQSAFTICSATMNRTSFAAFGNGTINPNGSWKLRVADAAGADVGTINNWSISFPQTITPSPDCGPVTSTPINIEISTPTSYYVDADLDGFGSESTQLICSSNAPAGFSTTSGDCNDNNSSINPNATEICGNSIDDNCDGQSDELCVSYTYYADVDGDGSGNYSSSISTYSNVAPSGYVTVFGDCNDNDSSIQSPITYYVDLDNDGIGSSFTASFCSSIAPAGFSTIAGDCDDDDASIQSLVTYYVDADGDGFGSSTTSIWCSAVAPSGFSSQSGDCNDNNSSINPTATEICGNSIDDNCNGQTDELCVSYTYYADVDGDGSGNYSSSISTYSNVAPSGYVTVFGDCNDNDSSVQSPVTYFVDYDNDGIGSSFTASFCSSTAPAGFSTIAGDCDDDDASIQSSVTYYVDADGDGFGSSTTSVWCSAVAPSGFSSQTGDCNDNNSLVNPNATEICGNGIDDNCNGLVDENTAALGVVASINGPIGVCKNQQGVTFSVDAVSNATNYAWTVPAGATIASGQGSTTITVNFSSTQTAGNICVTASNACLSNAAVCRSLIIYTAKPATPGVISGSNIEACANTTRTFSISPVTNATNYTWTAPTNATVISGQGTTSATISFGATFTSGTLSVKASNCIGVSSNKSMTIYSKPSTPSSITGTLNGVCGGTSTNYTCPLVTGATSYNWTAPAGWVINSGQGTNSINLTTPAVYTSGSVSVAASSACGTSTNRTVTVRSVPAVPGTVTGPSTNLCGGGTFTYSIAAVTGATGYAWTAPANCTITSNTGTSISLSVPANFTTGTLSVRSENACGQSAPKNVSLTRLPSTPATVTGTATLCSGSQGISYSTAAIAGLTYTWTVPAGANIASGQGTNSITVNWGTTQGNVSVKANNPCGSSSTRTFAVTLTACREMAEMTEETAVASLSIELYPNPGQGEFNLKFNGLNETANVRIYTVTGQIVQQFQVAANSQLAAFYLNDQADGIYFLRIETATEIKEIKVVKH
jgi:Zn-dependent metalloprotease/subtilisin-like proprotein convertase family protein